MLINGRQRTRTSASDANQLSEITGRWWRASVHWWRWRCRQTALLLERNRWWYRWRTRALTITFHGVDASAFVEEIIDKLRQILVLLELRLREANLAQQVLQLWVTLQLHSIRTSHSYHAANETSTAYKPLEKTVVSYNNKNSSGDEIANVNFYAVHPEATRIG